MAEGLDEDDDNDYDDDINALDDDYDEEAWYVEYADGEYDDDDDEDQVAYVDEEGWFYADEETVNVVDEMLTYDEDGFAAILTTYTEARGALAKARLARGFYPVVVPADVGPQPRVGRKCGKGEYKGKRKRKRKVQRKM